MNPVEFPQQTMVLAKNQPQYTPFPVHFDARLGACIGCFELNDEERAAIAAGGKIWLWQYTFGHPFQPVALTTDDPWATPPNGVTQEIEK